MIENTDNELTIFNKEFGKKLRKERKYREVTLEQIADIAHTSINTISIMERGECRVTVPILLAYCKALRMTPNDLLDYPQNSPNLKLTSYILTMSEDEQAKLLEIAKIIHNQ